MARILAVDDEEAIANLIKMSLTRAGYYCDKANDGATALRMMEDDSYDLIILDVMMPGIDGYDMIDRIKPYGIPVIFVTAKGALDDRVKGLNIGAEDYIVKPFEVAELIARVEVVLRRFNKTSDVYTIKDLVVDASAMRVTKGGVEINLTPKEFEILLLFLRTPNTALFRETIYERVWGGSMDYGSKTVDLHVQRLRKKTGLTDEIQSINKVGYRLDI